MLTKKSPSAVKKLSRRILAANRPRNLYVIAAIVLTTMLIATVFSIGMSYSKTSEMQQVRLMGTTAHAAVTNPTDEQVQKLQALPYVKAVGLQYNVGLIKSTLGMGNMTLSLHWYDRTEWNKFRMPAAVDIVGKYPEKYNEIMLPLWILNNMGMKDPQLGMEIPLSFFLGDDRNISENETFVLSGYCTEYSYIRSGNIGAVYVSEEFAKKSGHSVQSSGAASVIYQDNRNIERHNEQLTQDLTLSGEQKIKTVPMYETSESGVLPTVFAFSAIVLFLMFTGYLLIYNVFYISVSKDIRFYGLLKTVGTSPRQLKKIVTNQGLQLAAIGIPVGLAVGAILSFAAVPIALNLSDMKTGVELSFSPVIFISAALFALLTTMFGVAKASRIAAKISPVEALRFTGAQSGGRFKRTKGGGNPYRMVWRNIFRDRKRAVIVLLSLFLGISTFMIIITLISSMDTDNYVASYVKNDFILENNTLDAIGSASGKTQKQKFSADFLARLKEIDGITNLRTTTMEKMSMTYDAKQFLKHMDWFRDKFDIKEELTVQQIQNNFWGYILGIDRKYIEEFNKSSASPIDIEAFKRGDIALIGTDNPELYSNVDVMKVAVSSSGASRNIGLGGFVPFGFQYAGGGMAPNIYVSEEALDKLVPDPKIYKVNLDVEDRLEEQALEKIKAMTEDDYEISRTSKLEQQKAMSDTKRMMYILGGGIALVLALIGILNFINVMATGIMARKMEFAILESAGMTKRQMRRMIRLEGMGYAGITTLLTGTLGSAVTYGIFKLFQQQADYAIFTPPFIQMPIVIAIVFIVCTVAPLLAYESSSHASIVDRLREAE